MKKVIVGNEKSITHSISVDNAGAYALSAGARDRFTNVGVLRLSTDTSNHASDAVLKVAVLGRVYERVDTKNYYKNWRSRNYAK